MMLEFIRKLIYKIPVSKAFQEAILSVLRLAVIAFVSTVLTEVTKLVTTLPHPEIWIMALTAIGSAWDKYVYATKKEEKVKGADNLGLVGF